jgi:hypothetical protein
MSKPYLSSSSATEAERRDNSVWRDGRRREDDAGYAEEGAVASAGESAVTGEAMKL